MIEDSGGVARERSVTAKGDDGKTAIVTGLPTGARVVANGQLGITAGEQIAGSPNPARDNPRDTQGP
jgi:hypothetical protein